VTVTHIVKTCNLVDYFQDNKKLCLMVTKTILHNFIHHTHNWIDPLYFNLKNHTLCSLSCPGTDVYTCT
jgi:hypothetical protein